MERILDEKVVIRIDSLCATRPNIEGTNLQSINLQRLSQVWNLFPDVFLEIVLFQKFS